MLHKRITAALAGVLFLAGAAAGFGADDPKDLVEFREVYDLLRAHLAGASPAELNRAALEGLVAALGPKAALVSPSAATNSAAPPLLSKTNLFDEAVLYLRVGEVRAGLDRSLRGVCDQFGATNHLKGLVLDLRFAGGRDYAAAAAVADLFLKTERPLLNWGQGSAHSTAKTNNLSLAVAVLVNRQTAGAAEALAAVLRDAGAGLVLGAKTAGQALMFEEFPLKNGGRLRIATAPVQVGDGSPLTQGVTPDIAVEVSPADERAYFADAYKAIGPGAAAAGLTNGPRRIRFNEAELVRERRESLNPEDAPPPARKPEPEAPQVRDPALARALDLLKGLAVVRQARS